MKRDTWPDEEVVIPLSRVIYAGNTKDIFEMKDLPPW